MERYPFIFSNQFSHRLQRHACFWISWWIFHSTLYSFSAGLLNVSYFERLPVSAVEALIYMVPHMFLGYSLMYFAIPQFLLKGKYLQTVLVVIGLFVITGALSAVISVYILSYFRSLILGNIYTPAHINQVNFYLGLLSGLRGGLTIGGIAAAIKLMKYWHVKEQRNLQLQKEAISSQLQLLKAQVHPHFLFNTLNNIYAGTQLTSPAAAKMIMGLSQLLRYMLYECNQSLVPLDRELSMLKQYILLEQSRYGNKLDINMDLPSAQTGHAIAPLLLLPFIENCFKHGTSQMLEQPWISLRITVENDWLKMKLVNGKMATDPSPASGIGLANVQKRLALLYPGRHELVVNNEAEVFIVNLKLLLEKTGVPAATQNLVTAEQYA
ncbi:MAG TPA: histidine kinase [Flavisolibacter sp.]|jgi:sensor histidine kinase YesM|nr:histidine kinase [Flavisolibacter sp.]